MKARFHSSMRERSDFSSASLGVNDFREDLKRMMMEVTKGEGKAQPGLVDHAADERFPQRADDCEILQRLINGLSKFIPFFPRVSTCFNHPFGGAGCLPSRGLKP